MDSLLLPERIWLKYVLWEYLKERKDFFIYFSLIYIGRCDLLHLHDNLYSIFSNCRVTHSDMENFTDFMIECNHFVMYSNLFLLLSEDVVERIVQPLEQTKNIFPDSRVPKIASCF